MFYQCSSLPPLGNDVAGMCFSTVNHIRKAENEIFWTVGWIVCSQPGSPEVQDEANEPFLKPEPYVNQPDVN